jgi:iron(III) transport system ATP-binding protein
MLMDEPFSGLDNRLRDGIRDETLNLLKEDGTAVILVTHEPEEAMRMGDQIALMRAGQIVQQGAPYNVYNAPCDRAAAAFFSDINVVTGTVRGRTDDDALRRIPRARLSRRKRGGHRVPPPAREDRLRPRRARAQPDPAGRRAGARRGARARFMGHESLVEFSMDFDGSILKATVPGVFLPSPGKPLWLTVRRDRCFVFPHRD